MGWVTKFFNLDYVWVWVYICVCVDIGILIKEGDLLFSIKGKRCKSEKPSLWSCWEFRCQLLHMAEVHKNIDGIEQSKSSKKLN